MRQTVFALWFVLLGLCVWAQPMLSSKARKAAIQRVKNQPVSSFDHSLPKVTPEFFLEYESGGAPIRWEVNDCWEDSANPEMDPARDVSLCVEADFNFKDRSVAILVSAPGETSSDIPRLVMVTITDAYGNSRNLRQLGDLPMQLRRRGPKMPKDLPIPVVA